ncbi:MAG: hypothetical protein PHU85_14285 [Phycisphaerae bacterium]|nr:hypothetical protein [Phycisphaerae bacterium]
MSTDSPVEQPAVRTTIVGGRPPGCGKSVGNVPRGVEVLVKKAAVDPEFRATLLAKRAAAADEIGLRLEPAEALMLNAVPARQLEMIIGTTKVDPRIRPAFLGKVAAAMLVALGVMTISVNDGEAQSKGCLADRVVSPPATQEVERVKGERPDIPRDFGVRVAGVTAVPVPPAATQPATQPAIQPPVEIREMRGARIDRPEVFPSAGVRDPGLPPDPDVQQPPPTTQPVALAPDEYDKLIGQLDDPKYQVREAAERRLTQAGKPIQAALEKTRQTAGLPPEAAWRIDRIIQRLNPKPIPPPVRAPFVTKGAMRQPPPDVED